MARLVLQADPRVIASRPAWRLGMVIDVMEDGTWFHPTTLRSQPVIDVPDLSVADAKSMFCADGVPVELRQAVEDARAALRAANKTRDAKVCDAAEADLAAAEAATRGFPKRAVLIDLFALAPHLVATAEFCRQVLDGCAEEAKATAKSAVLSEWAWQKGRDLTPEEIAMETKDIVATIAKSAENALAVRDRGQAFILDQKQDAILSASRDGRALVEDAALAVVPVPEPFVVDAATLSGFLAAVKP